MSQSKNRLVDIEGEIYQETERAILFFDGNRKTWLPKSQIEINHDDTITMPEWLAIEKGLV